MTDNINNASKKLEEKKRNLENKLEGLKGILTIKQQINATEKSLRLLAQKKTSKARKDDTRKKILVGAFYLEQFEKSPENKQKFLAAFNGYLTRDDDRALFGFQPRVMGNSNNDSKASTLTDSQGGG